MRIASQRLAGKAGILATFLGFLGGLAAPGALAQTLYTVSRDDLELRVVDPATGATLSQKTMQFDPAGPFPGGDGVAWALAAHPTTGILWVVLEEITQGEDMRRLGTIDPNDPNAIVTDRGNLSDRFAGLAFDCNGNLYGVTDEVGARGTTDETLYHQLQLCTTLSCAPVLRGALGNGDHGEAIAFDTPPVLYHVSGRLGAIYERILNAAGNLADPNNIEDIGFAGGDPHPDFPQASAMTLWRAADTFLLAGQGNLFTLSRTGVMQSVGAMDHPVNGLAFPGQECGAGPTPTATVTPTGPTPTRTTTPTQTPTLIGTATHTHTPTPTFPAGGPYCSSASLTIPDNDVNGVTSVLSIPFNSVLSDVDVILNIAHLDDGDLKVTLTKGATTISLLDRPRSPGGALCTGNGVTTTMDDEAALPAHTNCSSSPPTGLIEDAYQPFQALSAFNGINLAGDWTLRVSDLAASANPGGELSSWCVVATSGLTPTLTPTRTGSPTPTPTITATGTATATPTPTSPPGCVELLEDGSFEDVGTPDAGWTQGSTNFGGVIRCEGTTPPCDTFPIDEYGAQTGGYFGLFGGVLADSALRDSRGVRALHTGGTRATLPEIGFVEQEVILTGGIGVLRFSFRPGFLSGNPLDVFRALLDTTEVFRFQGNGTAGQYRQIVRDIGNFADGDRHTLRFEGSFTGRASSPNGQPALSYFSLDDVSVCSAEPIITSAPPAVRTVPLLLLAAGLMLSLRRLRRRAR